MDNGNKRVHIVIDFMYLYYKYMFMLRYGRMSRLTSKVPFQEEEYDVSNIYYVLREIESIRKTFEDEGNEVVVSICFDDKSPERKQENKNYKSNRKNSKLSEDDVRNIGIIREMAGELGYNVYLVEAREADDVVYSLVQSYKDEFMFTVIYTPDTDVLINIDTNVGVKRYKSKHGYTAVGKVNFSDYCSQEFRTDIRYNAICLYKCLCGDTSDKIVGVKGFGTVAYENLVDRLDEAGIQWDKLGEKDYIKYVLEEFSGLSDDKLGQAMESLDLVFPRKFEVKKPERGHSTEKRNEVYTKYNMKSLI